MGSVAANTENGAAHVDTASIDAIDATMADDDDDLGFFGLAAVNITALKDTPSVVLITVAGAELVGTA